MKRQRSVTFPELQRVFSGYLHEDFVQEHGTPAAALEAFLADANEDELQRFRSEARRLLERTARLDFGQVKELLARLGSSWTPRSREAFVTLLTAATNASAKTDDT